MRASFSLGRENVTQANLAMGIRQFEVAQDRNAHPLLPLEVSAVVGNIPLKDQHGARLGLHGIPAPTYVSCRIPAGP
jgi:hypothetical protein